MLFAAFVEDRDEAAICECLQIHVDRHFEPRVADHAAARCDHSRRGRVSPFQRYLIESVNERTTRNFPGFRLPVIHQ